ncbi:MAG: tRNA dihydrouridine synthase DusB [Gammaproteobacteria bacterium]
MQIGPYTLDNPLILAPMAGVTDRPFRNLCRELGAALAVSEMVTSNSDLWHTPKTRLRLNHDGETALRSVQIAGTDPEQMAHAARFNVDNGADIIDINMGCPAKKVCHVMAGSALMKNDALVARIVQNVVRAVDVPVTLKIRTGWDTDNRNAPLIAHIAEDAGIQALAVHGRTRQCKYAGQAEYDTIAEIKTRVNIPVIANGDIDSPEKAISVLKYTGADGLMIGRAAQGNPWIFRQILHFIEHGQHACAVTACETERVMVKHLKNLYDFYGEEKGVRIARKHIGWYCAQHPLANMFWKAINQVESAPLQLEMVSDFLRNNSNNKRLAA